MKIGLVPMAAKPYHAGHNELVNLAAAENDTVYLFVSTSDRCRKGQIPIYGEDMKNIWCEEIEKVLPKNVIVEYGGSPVRKVIEFLAAAENELNLGKDSQERYSVYSDPSDSYKNYLTSQIGITDDQFALLDEDEVNLLESLYGDKFSTQNAYQNMMEADRILYGGQNDENWYRNFLNMFQKGGE